jgi:hypothetical protein
MKNKFLMIALLLLTTISAQPAISQSIRPLSINIEPRAHQDDAEWLWTPDITFSVRGPIETGSNITVEYTLPSGKPYVTARCETYPVAVGESRRFDLCGKDLPSAKAINQMGKFGFVIKLGNALSGDGKMLYSGKFTIARKLYNIDGTPEKNKQFYYFVDNDWKLQFAYVGTFGTESTNNLYTQFWVKNRILDKGAITGYLFYNGKQVTEVSPSYIMDSTPKENPKEEFQLVALNFTALMEKPETSGYDSWFKVYENPGDYEIKLIRDKKLARSIKFSIGKDGKLGSSGVGKELYTSGTIVPAGILGDTDGVFNKLAWKDGVFGNPISGLIVP